MNRNNLNPRKNDANDANDAGGNINRDVPEIILGVMPSGSVATKNDIELLKMQTKHTLNYLNGNLFALKKQLDELKDSKCKCKCSKGKWEDAH